MTQLTFLHLTDLHMGHGRLAQLWPKISQDLEDDLRYVVGLSEGLDLVLFTGDLTQSGKEAEFKQVDALLERLWALFAELGQDPRFLAVPGNHDMTWPDQNDPVLLALTEMWSDERVSGEFWSNPNSSYRAMIEDCFGNYREWWDRDRPRVRKVEKFQAGALPGDFSATFEKEALQIGVVGLNTAFLQLGKGVAPGKLALGLQQFHQACHPDGPTWIRKHDTCLLMTHHPAEWLRPDARGVLEGEIHYPPESFAAHLFGHMHEPDLRVVSLGAGSERRRLQGAALFSDEPWGDPPRARLNGYCIGRLNFENQAATLELWPRKATQSPGGGWTLQLDQESFTIPKGAQSTAARPVTLLGKVRRGPEPAAPSAHARPSHAKYAALVGPKTFRDVHDTLAELLSDTSHDPIHVKNIGLDMEMTWALIRDNIMRRYWDKKLVWQSLMADGHAASIQEAHGATSIISPSMAVAREMEVLEFHKSKAAFVRDNNIEFSCRAYPETPLMHGFLINDRTLFVGFCSHDGTEWATSPYLHFDSRPKRRSDLDDKLAGHFIKVFSNWFDTHWKNAGARVICQAPGQA